MNRVVTAIAALAVPERVRVYPLMLAGMFFVGWIATITWYGDDLLDMSDTFIGNDFVGFYTGATLWLTGQSDKLYDLQAQWQVQSSLTTGTPAGTCPYMNPPYGVLLYAPFAMGGYLQGLIGWWLAGLAAMVAALSIMRRATPALGEYSLARLSLMTLVFYPTLAWLSFGQATMFVLLIWAATFAALRSKHDFVAGLALSTLAFKPQLALPLTVAVIAGRRPRAIAGGAVGLALWGTLTAVWFADPFWRWLDQRGVLIEMLRSDSYPTWGIHSWFGFSNLLFPSLPGVADALTIVLSLGTIAVVAALWFRTDWQPGTSRWDGAMAITMALVPLAGVHLFVYDLALLMIPFLIVLALPACRRDDAYLDGDQVLGWTVAVYLACFFSSYLTLGQQSVAQSVGLPEVGVQVSVFMIVGWCFAVWRLINR